MIAALLPFGATAQPVIILGGELANSTASSPLYMEENHIWPTLKAAGLNTVLCPVSWELIEPEEGRFDWRSVDALLDGARSNGLHLVLLWFGTWKNSMSCYVPLWVKEGFGRRFTLAEDEGGVPQEILSAFCQNALKADCKAFATLMGHLKEVDGEQRTVLMVQVENEIGMLPSARDHCALAEKAWKKAGLSDDVYEQEKFQAAAFARYTEAVAAAGKKAYDLPMYVNAALDSRGRKPGAYPSAGPLARLADIWKAYAPSVDYLSPDIYDPGYASWIAPYDRPDNRLFVPEVKPSPSNAARVFYTLGRHRALGFSPFDIDNHPQYTAEAYHCLEGALPLIAAAQTEGRCYGVLLDATHVRDTLRIGDIDFCCSHDGTLSWSSAPADPSLWDEGGLMIIDLGDGEFLFLGTGVVTTLRSFSGRKRVGIGRIDEVRFAPDGTRTLLRRLNGDEDHQGRHIRLPYGACRIQQVKVYR